MTGTNWNMPYVSGRNGMVAAASPIAEVIEVAKVSFADRRNHCGDPDFREIPYERLASKEGVLSRANANAVRSALGPGIA
ncbi:MAG: hypothetical protein ACR2RB_02095 [Gammaproteobacteria bacterium]